MSTEARPMDALDYIGWTLFAVVVIIAAVFCEIGPKFREHLDTKRRRREWVDYWISNEEDEA